ncbi:VWA domain-containing protein [Myxococcota bacterium]|nr:VWA domain-containing protein [Myxococcota bacterium]
MRWLLLGLALLLPLSASGQNCEYPAALVVLDRSTSMQGTINNKTKWDIATDALSGILARYEDAAHFGLMLYPGPSGTGANGIEEIVGACDFNNAYHGCSPLAPHCTTGEVVVDVGANRVNQILEELAWPAGLSHSYTPTWQSLEAANDYYDGLGISDRRRFVVLITDGWQCCGLYSTAEGYQCAESDGGRMVDRIQRLKDNNITSFIIGFGSSVDRTRLHQMALVAGTARPGCDPNGNNCYYQADDEAGLNDFLDDIVRQISEEICDGLDNDCDGVVDDIWRDCNSACGAGEQLCFGGQWTECLSDGTAEVCNNFDDDCDGQVDEGLTRACNTNCGAGTEQCQGGRWINCTAPPENPDICDGLDNDCDGSVDPGCDCVPGETRPCGSSQGICRQGTQRCVAPGRWADVCEGGTSPRPETCNGLDDDCDGRADGITQGCATACGDGVATCTNGAWLNCTAPVPSAEACDGVDNDCDGLIDEGLSRACQGACGAGQETCVAGRWSACNVRQPAAEMCNNFDDDCDNQIDESLERDCQSVCGEGRERCLSGQWIGCDAPQPVAEICDGLDNDCDGLTDEDLIRDCQTECGLGEARCEGGDWVCDAPDIQPEICNGMDDDCDGQIDEGCSCVNGETQPCGSSVGRCQQGQQICANGAWGECEGATDPIPELCDGFDNDCDGQVDENLINDCSTPCGEGASVCQEGAWTPCDAPPLNAEICDNIDNDCNGETDEVCECLPGETRACGVTVGECTAGSQSCDAQGHWTLCEGMGPSAPEACDGLDNDCDGQVDEDLSRRCATACGEGQQICRVGVWQPCDAPAPVEEICDNTLDDDCDGQTNEDCECVAGDVRPCGESLGICEQGQQSCIDNQWGLCEGSSGGRAEVCNGLDDDCNGVSDEGELCPPDLRCACGGCVGACIAGECGDGANCVDGFCVVDQCPEGMVCEGSACVEGEQPGEDDIRYDGGVYPGYDRGLGGGADAADGGVTLSGNNAADGCGCRVDGQSRSGVALFFALLLLPALRRRRR